MLKADLKDHLSKICVNCYECKTCKVYVGAKVEDSHWCINALSLKLHSTANDKDKMIYYLNNRLNEKNKEISALY